ncbi:MAG: hypothetical protein ACOCWQ_03545 [Nanoarchaeota archaeon]
MDENLMEYNEEEKTLLLSLNPQIYTVATIMAAAYVFLDRAYILLDGEPDGEIIVEFKLQEESSDPEEKLKEVAHQFFNELIQHAVYTEQTRRNAAVKSAIYQRALLGLRGQAAEKSDAD